MKLGISPFPHLVLHAVSHNRHHSQQERSATGGVIATFLYTLLYGSVLLNIFQRMHALCSIIQIFAILADISYTADAHLASEMFTICTPELATIRIVTVPRKTQAGQPARLRQPITSPSLENQCAH